MPIPQLDESKAYEQELIRLREEAGERNDVERFDYYTEELNRVRMLAWEALRMNA